MSELINYLSVFALSLAVSLYPAYGGKEDRDDQRSVIHVIPHAHFDIDFPDVPAAQIDRQTRNIKKRLEYMRSGSGQTYTFDGTYTLRYFLDRYPEEGDFLRQMIKEGRIDLPGDVTGGLEMTMSQGESIVRNFVYGKVQQERLLGIQTDSPFGWNIDNYGVCQQLPQILRKCDRKLLIIGSGHDLHTPYRPDIEKKADFIWEGIGSWRIRTHRQRYRGIGARAVQDQSAAGVLMDIQGCDFCGPILPGWEANEAAARAKDPSLPWAMMSTPRKYMAGMGEGSELRVVKFDTWLNPAHVGCYECFEEVRQGLRGAENLLEDAEKFATIAYLLGEDYPEEVLNKGWERTLWNTHHDSILGCANDEAINIILQRNAETGKEVEAAYDLALDGIVSRINTEDAPSGRPMVVFNPCSWERTEVVEVPIEKTSTTFFTVKDTKNAQMPVQVDIRRGVLTFTAKDIPSFGYKTFFVSEEKKVESTAKADLSDDFMETRFYKVSFCDKGISEILHKPSGRKLRASGRWMPGEIFAQEEGKCGCQIYAVLLALKGERAKTIRQADQKVDIRLIDDGPVRKTVELRFEMFGSPFVQQIHIYEDIDRIDFDLNVDWRSKGQRFRVAFPTEISCGRVFFQEPFAVSEGWTCKPSETHKPVNQWMGYSESDGSFGVALVNHGTHHCQVIDDTIQMTLFKSGNVKSHCWWCAPKRPIMRIEESGKHHFRYSLIIHGKDWQSAGVNRRAFAVNHPVRLRTTKRHGGKLPGSLSFLRIVPDHMIITAWKKAYEGCDTVLRFYEPFGRETKVELSTPGILAVSSAFQANLQEEKISDNALKDGLIKMAVPSFSIETMLLSR
ncbi:MAG: glycoside hydrolase family 38 N-terminal domain-containing protein [Planctomycetota bacterium]